MLSEQEIQLSNMSFLGLRNVTRQRLIYKKNRYNIKYVTLFSLFIFMTIPFIVLSIYPKYERFFEVFFILFIISISIYYWKVNSSISEKEIDIETVKITSPDQFYGKIKKITGLKAILIFFIPTIIIIFLSIFLL